MNKKKIFTSLAAVVATTIFSVTPVMAQDITSIKLYELYSPNSYYCDEIENFDVSQDKIYTVVNSEKTELTVNPIYSIGLKKIDATTFMKDGEETSTSNVLYVLNNNLNSDCNYVPVYELTEENDGKCSFVMLGYYNEDTVYYEDEAYTEMSKYYQTDFILAEDDISETGTEYLQFDLPSDSDVGIELENGYEFKGWEYNYSSKEGCYFKSKVLPTDSSKIKTVRFYTVNSDNKYELTKTEDVEVGTKATAPDIEGEWDKSFDSVTDDIDVYEMKDGVSIPSDENEDVSNDDTNDNTDSANDDTVVKKDSDNESKSNDVSREDKATESVSTNSVNNPQTGDSGNMIMYLLGIIACATTFVLVKTKKMKNI